MPAFLERTSVDVIVLDLNLPDSNGAKSVCQIADANPGTPIVFLSGQGDYDTVREALQAGAQTSQVKDLGTHGSLVERIDSAILRKQPELDLAKRHIGNPL